MEGDTSTTTKKQQQPTTTTNTSSSTRLNPLNAPQQPDDYTSAARAGHGLLAGEEFVVPHEGTHTPTHTAAEEEAAGPSSPTAAMVQESLTSAAGWMKKKAEGAWKSVKEGTAAVPHKTAESLETVKDKVGEALGIVGHRAHVAAEASKAKIKESTAPITESAGEAYQHEKEVGKASVGVVKAQVSEATKAKVGSVVEKVKETAQETGAGIHRHTEATKEALSSAAARTKQAAQVAKERVESGVHTTQEVTSETMKAAAGHVGGATGRVSGWMEGVAGEVPQQQKEAAKTAQIEEGEGEEEGEEPTGTTLKVGNSKKRGLEEKEEVELAKEVASADMD